MEEVNERGWVSDRLRLDGRRELLLLDMHRMLYGIYICL